MNLRAWLEKAQAFLDERAIPEAAASAEFLMAETLGIGRGSALAQPARELTERQGLQFWSYVKERAKGLPVAYVLGYQPFLGLKIEVNRDALIPRPETEELVLECERLLKDHPAPKVLEIGTGTGCIAIALAQLLPRAMVFATDVSDKALALARKNALTNQVSARIRFIREDLFDDKGGPRGWADLVVSNPPYVPTAEVAGLAPEPALALDGGKDGLTVYRALIPAARKLIKPGGWLALEIGSSQGSAVAAMMEGFEGVHVRRDAQKLDRMVFGRLP
jgi:release factor glutamine methyltransferase